MNLEETNIRKNPKNANFQKCEKCNFNQKAQNVDKCNAVMLAAVLERYFRK